MPVWGWVLVVIGMVVILAIVVFIVMSRRRTAILREQFGPEYERTVETAGERRGAESQLMERRERRQQFNITSLAPAARERYQEDWRMIQSQFVDDPASAVSSADRMIQSVMRERGYPVEDFDQRADDLSVDYPHVVQNYREGRLLARAGRDMDKGSTEDLRRAFRYYRALFDELVGPVEGTAGSGEAPLTDSSFAGSRASEPIPESIRPPVSDSDVESISSRGGSRQGPGVPSDLSGR
jgi:hypothetical protein